MSIEKALIVFTRASFCLPLQLAAKHSSLYALFSPLSPLSPWSLPK